MDKKTAGSYVRAIFTVLLLSGLVTAFLTAIATTGGTAYRAGANLYPTWIECNNDNPMGTPCDAVEVSSFSNISEKLPGLISALLLLAAAVIVASSTKLKVKIGQFQKQSEDKKLERMAQRESEAKARLQREAELARNTESSENKKPENASLASMRSGTTAIIALGIVLGIIAIAILIFNPSSSSWDIEKRAANLATAGAWGQISEWLFAVGILGKLLIGAAKIIVEGLGGNIRSDKD